MRNKNKIKGIIGIILIFAVLCGLYCWENYGREELMYTDVVVFAKDVDRCKIVTKDMIGYMKIEKKSMIKDAITDPNDVLGKETVAAVPARLQLAPVFFEEQDVAIGNGRYVFSVPEDWICSYPQSLRRGDTVYIYGVQKDEVTDEYAVMNDVAVERAKSTQKPIVTTTVSYVKDSSNREVMDVTAERLDGTSVVGKLEIIVTDKDYKALQAAHDLGLEYLILYN